MLLAGCFDDVSNNTSYILKPLVQERSGDPVLPLEGLVAYAFDADTLEWGVASWEDALSGIITSKSSGEKNPNPYATAVPFAYDGASGWVELPLNKPSQMVLAVNTASRRYAYTQQVLPDNPPAKTYISLTFRLWKEGTSYKDNGSGNKSWSFYSPFYTKPQFLDCFVDPSVQATEDGEPSYLHSTSMDVYAFAADTTEWCILSYDDARVGTITSKRDPSQQRTTPSFKGYKQSSSELYKMTVSAPVLMVVVVDKMNRIYAYTRCDADLEGESPTWAVTLRPWIGEWKSVEEGWCMVNDTHRPEEDSNTEKDE